MVKTALLVRHVPYEGIAGFRAPIEDAGYAIDRVDVTEPRFAAIDFMAPDLVILMGGPMGVYERAQHPWLDVEIGHLKQRLAASRPTLGICLGAQIVAASLGARVYPGPVKEIGFHPITLTAAGADSPLANLDSTPVLHWHGDTFDLPPAVEWLASSPAYPHQAFRRGKEILALQFHAEMGLDPRIDHWIESSADILHGLSLCGQSLRADYDRIGPHSVSAGQAMIRQWLAELA